MERPQVTKGMRGSAESFALFDAIHEALNARLPYGRVTKAETFDLVVSSARAYLAETGRLSLGQTHEATVGVAAPPLPEFGANLIDGRAVAFPLTRPRPPDDDQAA